MPLSGKKFVIKRSVRGGSTVGIISVAESVPLSLSSSCFFALISILFFFLWFCSVRLSVRLRSGYPIVLREYPFTLPFFIVSAVTRFCIFDCELMYVPFPIPSQYPACGKPHLLYLQIGRASFMKPIRKAYFFR